MAQNHSTIRRIASIGNICRDSAASRHLRPIYWLGLALFDSQRPEVCLKRSNKWIFRAARILPAAWRCGQCRVSPRNHAGF